jgi:hypothetical protein
MRQIENIGMISGEWNPSDIAFIKGLELSVNNLKIDCLSQSRKNTGSWPDVSKPFIEAVLLFSSISNLKIDFKGKSIQQVTGFDIIDISKDGWEGINFQIEEYENNSIGFNCKKISIVSVLKPKIVSF